MNSFLKLCAVGIVVCVAFAAAPFAYAAINITFHDNAACMGADDDTLNSGAVACTKATGLGTEHIHHIEIFDPSNTLFATSTSGTGNREVSFTPVACGVWTAKVVTDADGSIQATRTFTIGNCAPTTATLTLVKLVTNDNGGTALATAWTLSGSGPTPISGVTGAAAVTGAVVNPGSYNLSESGGPAGYSASAWVCTGGTQNDVDTVTLAAGQNATCTITNNDQAAYIIVDKTVVNDNGGAAAANDFLLTVDGNAALDGALVPVNPGAHTVGETNLPGYTAGTWGGDCNAQGSVTVALGETKTCTITNNDSAPGLTLVKVVVNDNGGTATPADWTLTATGPTGFSGFGPSVVNSDVDAGTYDLSENGPAGYTASDWVCVGGNQTDANTVAVGLGDSVTCTITNDDEKVIHPPPPGDQCRVDIIIVNGGTIQSSTGAVSRTGGNTAKGSFGGDAGSGGNGGDGGDASADTGASQGGSGGHGGNANGGNGGRGGVVETGNATSHSSVNNILNRVNALIRR